jgi:hypothetical protein
MKLDASSHRVRLTQMQDSREAAEDCQGPSPGRSIPHGLSAVARGPPADWDRRRS